MTLVNQDMEKENWLTHVHEAKWSTWVLINLRPNNLSDNCVTCFYFSEKRQCTVSQLVDPSGRGICMIYSYKYKNEPATTVISSVKKRKKEKRKNETAS